MRHRAYGIGTVLTLGLLFLAMPFSAAAGPVLLSGSVATRAASVNPSGPGLAATPNALAFGGVTRLNSGNAETCAQIEPVENSYRNTGVSITTFEMISPGTGSVDRNPAIAGKTTLGTDRDHDGIEEITACFAKSDLRALFSGLSGGRQTVGVTLEGSLATGGRFRAPLDIEVVASGHSVAATVSPNPLSPSGTLTFFTTRPGSATVILFDSAGRLVRTMMPGSFASAGYHDVAVDGRSDGGARLPSGVYFYRVEPDEGVVTGRVAILK